MPLSGVSPRPQETAGSGLGDTVPLSSTGAGSARETGQLSGISWYNSTCSSHREPTLCLFKMITFTVRRNKYFSFPLFQFHNLSALNSGGNPIDTCLQPKRKSPGFGFRQIWTWNSTLIKSHQASYSIYIFSFVETQQHLLHKVVMSNKNSAGKDPVHAIEQKPNK